MNEFDAFLAMMGCVIGLWLIKQLYCRSGGLHQWEPFQTVHNRRCGKCGIIEDRHGRQFDSWEEYKAFRQR